MKVRPLLSKVNTKTFIEDLLTAYGVRDVDSYLHPNSHLFKYWAYPILVGKYIKAYPP